MKNTTFAFIATITLITLNTTRLHATLVFSDFSFGSGTPFSGSTTLAGVGVTLTTTNTVSFGVSSFRGDATGSIQDISFTFSQAIPEFHLDIRLVRADEFLHTFNIGNPTALSGNLVQTGSGVTTSLVFPDDGGFGRLSWTGLNTSVVSFQQTAPVNASVAFDQFGLDLAVVPEPSAFTYLMLICGVTSSMMWRRLCRKEPRVQRPELSRS